VGRVNLVALNKVSYSINNLAILEDISLDIQAGEILTLIGPNGAGKSTLIKLILGMLAPVSGSIQRLKALKIGYVPQKITINTLVPLTVQRFLYLSPAANPSKISKLAEKLMITKILHRPVSLISGGEFQRVLLARALINEPELLVLDEPAQAVDVTGQAELYALIRNVQQELACTVLMVSHDLHIVMAGTDRVICLNKHICCHGCPQKVSLDPEFTKLFGNNVATNLALYAHSHNHEHHLHGGIVK
jgi:zinc transport system ATP-binding protein